MLNDQSKFQKVTKKVETVINEQKRKINDIISAVNTPDNTFFKKVIGHVAPGYLYGNCKIHKNLENPPLRPVISTIPTPAYEISKVINEIISRYMPNNFCVRSTNEFLEILKTQNPDNLMASLDVESLFTSVPVEETIDIILKYVYDNEELAAPTIPKHYMKALLILCTT
jgi:hypothetical protein